MILSEEKRANTIYFAKIKCYGVVLPGFKIYKICKAVNETISK